MEDSLSVGPAFSVVFVIGCEAHLEALQGYIWRRNKPISFSDGQKQRNNFKIRESRQRTEIEIRFDGIYSPLFLVNLARKV